MIAFYENDEWWRRGFAEWANVGGRRIGVAALGAAQANGVYSTMQMTQPVNLGDLLDRFRPAGTTAPANVEDRSERIVPPVDLAGLREVPVEITVAGSVRELVAIGQPREVPTTLRVSGYVLPGAPASEPEDEPQGPRKD